MHKSCYYREAPSVTVFLFAYNQEKFVEAACRSILSQDYEEPIQIIFSDDCSEDGTFEIMTGIAESYEGIHTLHLNRNDKNLGLIAHINLSYSISTGDLIVGAAGDDISSPNRVTENIEAYRKSANQPMSLYSSVYEMTHSGKVGRVIKPPYTKNQALIKYASSQALIIGAAHAWHRNIFEVFGSIEEPDAYEDLVLAYRSALLNGLVYIDIPLVKYRIGVGVSQTGKHNKRELLNKEVFVDKKTRQSTVMIAVLNQRLKDTLSYRTDSKLISRIESEIVKENIRNDILTGKYGFFEGIMHAKTPYNIIALSIFHSRVMIRNISK